MNYFYRFLVCIGIFIHYSKPCNASDTTQIKILFIGNSLTYTNNLPLWVQEIAKQDSTQMKFKSLCFADYSLEDHWNDGNIQKEITSGQYDYVVAQQGPSALPESQVLLIAYAKKIAGLCTENNTRFCLFTVWPSKARSFDHEGVITSYRNAAAETKSLLAEAGLAWKMAWQLDAQLALYGPDEFHPSKLGSLLAAMTIYGCLKEKKSFQFLHNRNASWLKEVTDTQLSVLVAAVSKTLKIDN